MENKNPYSEFDKSFISEYINDMKEMMQEFKDEFGLDINNSFKSSNMYKTNYIPVEIRETSNQLEIYISISNSSPNDIDVRIKDNKNIYIKFPCPIIQPSINSTLVYSEFPKYFEREIQLPQPINTYTLEKETNHGLLCIKLFKDMPDFDLPIDI